MSDHIRELIRSGKLAKGERLPATRELAGLLGVNRTTVSAAYERLESEGWIAGHVGRGSFVTGDAAAGDGLDWDELLERSDPPASASAPPVALARSGISFATSRPSERLFPLDDFRASCEEVMHGPEFAAILQLGSPHGYEPLRRHLLAASQAAGVVCAEDDLLITSGCQQALDLLGRVLLRPGDKVIVEDPVYPGLKNLFSRAGARLVGVPVGPEGLDVEFAERALERERPRLLVVTSDFQNPTGTSLGAAARQRLVRAAREARVLVIENDLYGELRYRGTPLAGLKQLDLNVVLLRSFSKITFPGLRVGWVVGPRRLVARLAEAKQLADLHTDQLAQAVLLRFAESGRLEAHCARMLAAGAERLAAVLEACERWLPPGASWTRPQGGMNLWVQLPEPLDAGDLLGRAVRAGAAYLPGKYFAVSRPQPRGLRLSFAGLDPGEIRKGLSILGQIFATELEISPATRGLEPTPALV